MSPHIRHRFAYDFSWRFQLRCTYTAQANCQKHVSACHGRDSWDSKVSFDWTLKKKASQASDLRLGLFFCSPYRVSVPPPPGMENREGPTSGGWGSCDFPQFSRISQ